MAGGSERSVYDRSFRITGAGEIERGIFGKTVHPLNHPAQIYDDPLCFSYVGFIHSSLPPSEFIYSFFCALQQYSVMSLQGFLENRGTLVAGDNDTL